MTASALVNNIGVSPEGILDCPPAAYSSYGWLSPRISLSCDLADGEQPAPTSAATPAVPSCNPPEEPETTGNDLVDFEFRLDDPVVMLPADELFSDGKLVPLHPAPAALKLPEESAAEIRSPETMKSRRRADPYVFSPKAPRCSSRWRELLGFKKAQSPKPDSSKPAVAASKNTNPKSLKHFLHRNPRSPPADSSLSVPLLHDLDPESMSIYSRMSISSSGPDHQDLPRISLDSEKPAAQIPISLSRNPPRVRVARPRSAAATAIGDSHPPARIGRSPVRRAAEPGVPPPPPRGLSVDSPRINPAGKIVFQGLERSSSSPGSFHGGLSVRPRGMERSYSAIVRVTPVLNVPVCSLRGSAKSVSVFAFGQLFSAQKKDRDGSSTGSHSSGRSGSAGGAKIKGEKSSRD